MSQADGNVHVREYTPRDFPQLCAIDRLCFPEGISYTPEEVALGLAQPGAFALVAEAQDQVVGFVLASQRRKLGHIVTIDLLPEFRRQGLGRDLMQRAEQRLRERDATRILLEVSVDNEAAIRFYEKLGYIHLRRLPCYYNDSSDAYLMEKACA